MASSLSSTTSSSTSRPRWCCRRLCSSSSSSRKLDEKQMEDGTPPRKSSGEGRQEQAPPRQLSQRRYLPSLRERAPLTLLSSSIEVASSAKPVPAKDSSAGSPLSASSVRPDVSALDRDELAPSSVFLSDSAAPFFLSAPAADSIFSLSALAEDAVSDSMALPSAIVSRVPLPAGGEAKPLESETIVSTSRPTPALLISAVADDKSHNCEDSSLTCGIFASSPSLSSSLPT
mmetsp:Transcript_50135/g.150923  ORF Transcript_50135/g.150923 Transcript_50135/m.150923 type:complete len:231 (-) Transcript_50135:401-1093(-)